MIKKPSLVTLTLLTLFCLRMEAVDLTDGVVTAIPVPDRGAPEIDADLGDWDLSTSEPVYISVQTAASLYAEWALMYDEAALYVGAEVSLPNRPYVNRHNPQDAFWADDILQMRLASDPDIGYPLEAGRDSGSDRVHHISFWKNQETDEDFLHISHGIGFNHGTLLNPEGSAIELKMNGEESYVMEARIPWSALNVPDGKNPFESGESAAFVAETLWVGGDKSRVALGYRVNPGAFAFNRPQTWGRLQFVESSPGERVRPTLEEFLAEAQAKATAEKPRVGVPITVRVPEDGLKASVNIIGEEGAIIREVIAAEAVDEGELTVYWDGKDAFGHTMEPGTYRWGAYFHAPLEAEYQGGVGASGHPFYKTLDNTGAWGGDHGNPVDAASDEDSLYMLWTVSEAGQALIKTDLQGKVIWRKNPYVGGGFGPFYSVATDGEHVYLARGDAEVFLVRLDADTGALRTWGEGGPGEISIYKVDEPRPLNPNAAPMTVEKNSWRDMDQPAGTVLPPDPLGMAVRGDKVYMSSYSGNTIYVINAADGTVVDELACPAPRGLAIDDRGDLYAVSYDPKAGGEVLRFTEASGSPRTVVDSDLDAPYDVAFTQNGTLVISDLGASQQVKFFDSRGNLVKTLGNRGGRPWQGAYDPEALSFLQPSGLTVDAEGAVVVTESSPPKVISRIGGPGGKLLNRWYGPGVYWNATWPMPDDPRNVFYQLGHAIGRADLAGPGEVGVPNAYWDPARAGYPHVGDVTGGLAQPETIVADNGELYLIKDTRPHTVFHFKNDLLRPVATWIGVPPHRRGNETGKPYIEAWVDQNGDGQIQKHEQSRITKIGDGSDVPDIAPHTAAMHMEPNGDLYFTTNNNCILKLPASGFGENGLIEWAAKDAHLAVPEVIPGKERLHTGWRQGTLGVRLDSERNIYTVVNTKLKGGTGAFDYPDEAYANRMLEGMGHTSSSNLVKVVKFDPEGNLLWMAGRKATAGAGPGEMYHFWNIAGVVNDKYVAGGSEWGQIYFYTHDGFFVDALMNNPGEVAPPGPYTFGGETSGARVAYFDASGELWAYSSGMAYKVKGFADGAVEKESRSSGTVELDQVYTLQDAGAEQAGPLEIVKVDRSPMADARLWNDVPSSALAKGGRELASAQLSYDENYLYGRISVIDDSPLQNAAVENQLAFKTGDTAGIVLGPDNDSSEPGKGDVRLMAVNVGGEPKLIAMKAMTDLEAKPFTYETPAAGEWIFEYVGEVPGGKVDLRKSREGYVASFAVPREFLEFDLESGAKLRGDVEVRLSGVGQRGLQAVSRNYLFTPDTAFTTMVDDIPTEARLYPEYWGPVEVSAE